MSHLRCASAVALALVSVVLLSGCSAQYERFTDLQGDGGGRDELPQLADYAYDDLDESTSRFVGEHEGTSLWLAQGLEYSTVCLVADAGENSWVVACGAEAIKLDGVTGKYEVLPDGATAPDGATKVSENVYAWDLRPE